MHYSQLICSPAGDLSESKIFTLLAKAVFTWKMVSQMPDDVLMWVAYVGLVGGIELAKKLMVMRYGAAQTGAPTA